MPDFDFDLNLDPAAIPQHPIPEPREIRAGDTLTWSKSFDQFPPDGGYSLSYMFVCQTVGYAVGGSMITPGMNNYTVKVPATTTAAWTPGWYRWQAFISDGNGNRYTVGEGKVQVLPNLQLATGGIDDREPDEVILDNIVALLNNKATADVNSYEIAGRRLDRYSWTELMLMRSTYEKRVRAIRIRRGERPPTQTIGVGFRYGY